MRKLLQVTVGCFLFLAAYVHGQAQSKIITGKITGAGGQPLEGVSVLVKGFKNGASSNAQGTYSITVAENAKTLVFSIVEHTAQEIPIQGRTSIDVVLQNNNGATLDGVVLVNYGYGNVRKSDLTGAVGSVKGSDLTKLPIQRVDQALQGRTAGVAVQNTDGAPGGNATIRVRGSNSITGGNNALVVVDGLQGVNISTLNPNDIETLEVLKDASATAIYGARGANGVIIITTKKGVSGKPALNYNYSYGNQKLNKKFDLLNTAEFAQKSNDYSATQNGTVNAPITPVIPFTQAQIDSLKISGGTDWQNEIYRTAALINHQLSFGGGSENVKYFISGGMMEQEGMVINTKYKRYSLRSNIDIKATRWLNAGININVIKDKGNVPPVGEGTRYGSGVFGQVINTVLRFDPATPVYDANGNYNFRALKGGPNQTKTYADPDMWNPVAIALETFSEKNNITNNISTFLDFKLLDALTFRVTGAASIVNSDNQLYYGSKTYDGSSKQGVGDMSNDQYQYYQNSNILTYDKTFNKKHHLTATGVFEQQVNYAKGTNINAQGYFNDATAINDLGGAQQINTRTNYDTKQVLNSYLGRVQYAFANKYLVTASYRADGSSVFGENNKWGYFPSAAVAWKVTEESFMKSQHIFSNLKMRLSWGETGNQAIAPYGTLRTVLSTNNGEAAFYPYNGNGATEVGFNLGSAGNSNLKWETTAQTNIGVDMAFLNGRISATVDLYKKTTTDLLLNKPVESYTGFASIISNVGSVENKGIEISVNATPVQGNFTWTTGINVSKNESKVLSLVDDKRLLVRTSAGNGYGFWSNGQYAIKNLVVGQPIGLMLGYVNLGTWSEAERAEAKLMGQLPGDAKWKDVNGDGKITRADDGNEIIGNSNPDFIFGWNNNFNYKNFDLSFLIQGSKGNDIFNAVRIKTENPSNGIGANLNNRWTINNQNTDVPAFTSTKDRNAANLGSNKTAGIGGDTRSSRWIEDGSYVRLKVLTLSYNLPASVIQKLHASKLSVFVAASNLFTITNYTGYDPEVSSYNIGSDAGTGIDLSNYPTAKTFNVGINLTF